MYPRPIKICASLTCADFLHLERDIQALEAAGVDYMHIDVMDGTFVPNYCLSPATMRTARRATDLPMDVHLMMKSPSAISRPLSRLAPMCWSSIRRRRRTCSVRWPGFVTSGAEPVLR